MNKDREPKSSIDGTNTCTYHEGRHFVGSPLLSSPLLQYSLRESPEASYFKNHFINHVPRTVDVEILHLLKISQ